MNIRKIASLVTAFTASATPAAAQFWPSPPEPYYGDYHMQQPPIRPRPTPKVPHTGFWSSWENGQPVGGNKQFADLPGCYQGMVELVRKFNYDVHLTCENDKGAVVLYQVCKPVDGTVECYSKLR